MIDTATAICGLIAAVFGAGWGSTLLFFRQKRRKERASADGAELDTRGKLIEQYEHLLTAKNTEEADLKQELKEAREEARTARSNEAKERDKVTGLFRELSDARVDAEKLRGALAITEYNKCEVVRCNRRQPPRIEQTEREQ